MRGFISYLFLILLASISVSQYALQRAHGNYNTPSMELQSLAFKRSELEQGMDRIIAEKLREGMLLHLTSEQIKPHINQALFTYLHAQSNAEMDPIQMEVGFAHMQTTNYLSLAQVPVQPLSEQQLNTLTHVFVLPINPEEQYGEYTYTGGAFGTTILIAQLTSHHGKTIAALPSGYRICVIDILGEIPCA
ncbi:MAG: hypothetical protein IPJ89_00055 [Candidatus Iainarchaeum archaeon]|uniref:Uncharacterized protein n=1 Tax=Candidatus Iainarchaeum sp. TaxID=3101447 RepID=A0A7T9DJY6_9ARCH|nr:MAG: hypothetical protein IPJ89_00055 [Candidatus Diapherotrites archaeon]